MGNFFNPGTVGNPFGSAIDSSEIADGAIVNADVNASAAIVLSKLGASTATALTRTDSTGNFLEESGVLSTDGTNTFNLTVGSGILDVNAGVWAGSVSSGGTTTISSTTNGTKGNIYLGSSTGLNYDEVNNRLGMGVAPAASEQVKFLMTADEAIVIDGTTNQRTIDTGVIRFEQTPSITNTRCVTCNVDANSQDNTHAIVVNMVATDIAAGEVISAYDLNIDRSTATGGVVRGFEISCSGAGTIECQALHVSAGVIPLTHSVGVFGNIEQAWGEDGTFPDVTAAFNSAGSDVEIFPADNDNIHIGMAAAFDQIEVNLAIVASGPGIKPTFEYSSGGGTPVWTAFTPSDETQGFRQTGVISWSIADLTGPTWAVSTINAVSKFWIRITRTQNSLTTAPTEDTIQVSSTSTYTWDSSGTLSINALTTAGALQANNTLTVGVDDTGYDVKFFGASAGAFALWDETNNLLDLRGATAAGPGTLKLTTGELTNVDGGILGRIDFQAPLDSAGTDAILVAASIWAEADATFSASVNSTDLVFATGDSETAAEKMRIDSTGNVGIAVTAPLGKLDIAYGSNTTDATLVLGADGGGQKITRTNSTAKIATIGIPHYTNAEEMVQLAYLVSDGTDNRLELGTGNGSANGATKLRFFTSANDTTVGGTKQMEIAEDGGVFFYNLLSAAGSTDVNINGSNELHSVSSSKRYKENIVDSSLDTKKFNKIRITEYDFKKEHGGEHEHGIIAEELEELYPKFVVKNKEGQPESVQYSRLCLLLIKKVQELEEKIQELFTRNG